MQFTLANGLEGMTRDLRQRLPEINPDTGSTAERMCPSGQNPSAASQKNFAEKRNGAPWRKGAPLQRVSTTMHENPARGGCT
jgi:hypothetical protein